MVEHIEQAMDIGKADLILIDKIMDKLSADVKREISDFINVSKPANIEELMRCIRELLKDAYSEVGRVSNAGQESVYKHSFTGIGEPIAELQGISWANSFSKLSSDLKTTVLVGMYLNKNNREVMKDVQKRFDISSRAAHRLVRTEYAKVCNKAELDSYNNLGIEYYEFYNIDNSRTSDICHEMNGKIFKVSDAQIGVNYPPLHNNCRSTTLPIVNKK